MKHSKIYQIALAKAKHIGAHHARLLSESMGGSHAVFCDVSRRNRLFPKLKKNIIAELNRPDLLEEAEAILRWCEKEGVMVYSLEDENYPSRLRHCPDAPFVIYTKGDFCDWECKPMLSIVGTRQMSAYGKLTLERLVKELATLMPQLTIVSGLAYGIDIEAHRLALNYNLPTIAVLAHGLDRIYPSGHYNTAQEMLHSGAWLSEYPPKTTPDKFNFVARNRIIAGLSDATLVVEAGIKSGSLITANLASDYNREVLCVPGRLGDPFSEGCNKLIAQMRGILISSGEDILQAMGWEVRDKQCNPTFQFPPTTKIDHPLLDLIKTYQPIHLDDLSRKSGLTIPEVSNQLFELELDGHVRSLPGGIYALA